MKVNYRQKLNEVEMSHSRNSDENAENAINLSADPQIVPTSLHESVPPLRRTLLVSIKATLDDLITKPTSAVWKPSNKTALNNTFKQRKFTSLEGDSELLGDLSSVVLHDLSVVHTKSTFPVPIGANIFSVDNEAYGNNGRAFSHVIAANSERQVSKSLQKDAVEMAYNFSSKFPGFTAKNLRTKGVTQVSDKRFCLIENSHPICAAISENADKLQLGDVLEMPEGLMKVSSSLFDAMIGLVETQVGSQVRVRDFNAAQISIHPSNHTSWETVRRELVDDKMKPLEKQFDIDSMACPSEKIDKLKSKLQADRVEIEARVDHTPYQIDAELDFSYNFLDSSSGND